MSICLLRPLPPHHGLGVGKTESTALHVALRSTAGVRADDGVLAACFGRLLQALRDESSLHATPTVLRQSRRAEKRGNASFRNHPSTATAHHLTFDAREERKSTRQRRESTKHVRGH